MNATPFLLLLAGGAALYLGLEARKARERAEADARNPPPQPQPQPQPTPFVYCDVTKADCPPDSSCVKVFGEGLAPSGQENLGICMSNPQEFQN